MLLLSALEQLAGHCYCKYSILQLYSCFHISSLFLDYLIMEKQFKQRRISLIY